jgi:predicted TIM-barrel fold metal-dependent hydrolase
VAYITGLEIKRDPIEEVRKAYEHIADRIKAKTPLLEIFSHGNTNAKKVLDYFVYQSLENSVKLKVPFQIHAAMGAVPNLDLRIANPILLYDFINDSSAKEAKIILVHGGYPYVEEAGFLVNTYPQVFLDFSETIPHISIGVKEKLMNLFEMAPTNKIMYGSDGYTSPEQYWISTIQTKKALADALNELVESNWIDENWAKEIGKQILSENATRIFNL